MSNDYLERILKARVYDVAIESPLEHAPRLSRRLGNTVLFKREDMQPVFSFKIRGAYNKIAHLSDTAAGRGVICASAGNHAQGVALAARKRGIKATIVMPLTTPQIKVQAVIDFGGEAVLHGDDYDQAYEHALSLARERQLTFIHPFDDPDVIAGQGTIGVEILRQCPGDQIDAIFVGVGGGGLISGIATYVKHLFPQVRIIGVEPEDADAMHQSLRERRRITLDRVGTFADGVAVRRVGEEPFRLAQQYVDEVILVSNDEICAAIQDIFEDNRAIVEPAGALSVAGIKKYVARENCRERTFVGINCGANMNFDRLRFVAERADVGEAREAVFALTIPEKRGSFLRLCDAVGNRAVTEFNYRISDPETAHVFVGLQISSAVEQERLAGNFRKKGFPTLDLSGNELAKTHLRYMVGGRSALAEHEMLFRFEFPERPGALIKFLGAMSPEWNISLFHYRNQGDDYGRILVGIQVPPEDKKAFKAFLDGLGYPYWNESENPAYQLFL